MRLAALATAERARLDGAILFPVPLAIGIALYFSAPDEPSHLWPALIAIALAAMALLRRRAGHAAIVIGTLAAIAVGFAAAGLRTERLQAPMLTSDGVRLVDALVLSVEPRPNGARRLVLRPVAIEGLAAGRLPARLRVTVRADDVRAGDSLRVRALLRAPPGPTQPGGYDFAFDAFYSGIGGSGFAYGRPERIAPVVPTWREQVAIELDHARNRLTARIVAIIGGDAGALAAAQVTGLRGYLSEEATDEMRDSGLYHIVSISGLHMAIFAGGLFFAIRAVLALFPRLALTMPIKTVAACVALAPAAAYTIFSGAEVATVRAFLMTALVLLAVAVSRRAATRRNVALAASAVLIVAPESLFAPGFQMSFAAVAMLVAWHERHRAPPVDPPTPARRALTMVVLLGMTTILASLATAPFVAYHFHRLTLQGLIANLLATPIVSGFVMPLSLLALAAEPFGYGPTVWWLVGLANQAVLLIAGWVAGFPGANVPVPQFPPASLALLALAILVVAILRTRLVLVAIVPAIAGLALAALSEQPLAYVGANGHAFAARSDDGVTLVGERRDRFALQEWLGALGDGRDLDDPSLADRRCESRLCRVTLADGHTVALARDDDAIEAVCGDVDVLVTPRYAPDWCREISIVLDRDGFEVGGPVTIYADPAAPSRLRLVRTRDPAYTRPWLGGP